MRGYGAATILPLRIRFTEATPIARKAKQDRRRTAKPIVGHILWLDIHASLTYRQIATRLGCDYDLVYNVLANGYYRHAQPLPPPPEVKTMSYNFTINAKTKEAAKALVAEKLAVICEEQPAHAIRLAQDQAAADSAIDSLGDKEEYDIRIDLNGSVSVTPDSGTAHNVYCAASASLVFRS